MAYGVSENSQSNVWKIENPVTLKDYFERGSHGEIVKYGNAYLFKSYKISELSSNEINADLNKIIGIYKGQS